MVVTFQAQGKAIVDTLECAKTCSLIGLIELCSLQVLLCIVSVSHGETFLKTPLFFHV